VSDSPNLNADPELLAGFLDESRDLLAGIADQLVALEQQPDNLRLVEGIFRAAHSIKGNSAFFGFLKAKHLAHRLENVLDAVRKGRLVPDSQVISLLLRGFDVLTLSLIHI
jgi:two-component system chemotaxis sensor kinase CheA